MEKESAKLAEELKTLGFNMNFAPVMDLNINPKNPVIGALGRSFSVDPEEVYNQARVFMENHLEKISSRWRNIFQDTAARKKIATFQQ